MNIRRYMLQALLLVSWTVVSAQTRIIAHRGYWDYAGGAENSLASLEASDRIGAYGSEFDVHITRDGRVVVFHDDCVVTDGGRDTLRIEHAAYRSLRKVRLANGERIPTLEQYLKRGRKTRCRLVLEIKEHLTSQAEDRCVRKVLEAVRAAKMEDRVDYISFSRYVCRRLRALAPRAEVAYLNGDLTPREVKDMGLTGIDYRWSVIVAHPEWVGECRQLGLSVNVWTVNAPRDMERYVRMGVDFITTNRPVEALRMVAR